MTAKLTITGTIRKMSDLQQVGTTHKLVINIPEDRRFNGTTTTAWHQITLWGKLAESANKFLRSGSVIEAECRIDYNKSGETYYTNFTAYNVTYHANFGERQEAAA